MGHFSAQTHNDTWIEYVFSKHLNLWNFVNEVQLYHDRVNNTLGIDFTDVARDTQESSPEFYSEKYQKMILEDVDKIKAFLALPCQDPYISS